MARGTRNMAHAQTERLALRGLDKAGRVANAVEPLLRRQRVEPAALNLEQRLRRSAERYEGHAPCARETQHRQGRGERGRHVRHIRALVPFGRGRESLLGDLVVGLGAHDVRIQRFLKRLRARARVHNRVAADTY